jgi:hypothetical protein
MKLCAFLLATWNEVNLLTDIHGVFLLRTQDETVPLCRIHRINIQVFTLCMKGNHVYLCKINFSILFGQNTEVFGPLWWKGVKDVLPESIVGSAEGLQEALALYAAVCQMSHSVAAGVQPISGQGRQKGLLGSTQW